MIVFLVCAVPHEYSLWSLLYKDPHSKERKIKENTKSISSAAQRRLVSCYYVDFFCTLGGENKRFCGGQSFEVTQAIANICFKEARQD